MEPTQWEYVTHIIKNPEIHELDNTLNYFGRGGWELITMTSTIKFWNRATGNDLVLVFKRPTTEVADLGLHAPALYDDQGTPIKDPLGLLDSASSAPRPAAPDEGYHGA